MNFFSQNQAGFRKGKSTQELIFRITQDIFNGFKMRKCTIGAFLDVQAAFDAVWTNGLKYKIKRIGLPPQLQNLLFSFLKERSLRVNVENSYSETVYLRAGTPQGSCLSPILYLIFVNDISDAIADAAVSLGQYADDIAIYSTSRDQGIAESCVQNGLNSIMKWCKTWQVTMNPQKSQVVLFSKCTKETHDKSGLNLKLFDKKIPVSNEAVYLGITFDHRLSWEQQTTKMANKAYGRLNLMRAIAGLSSKPNPNLLSKLYNSTVRSI